MNNKPEVFKNIPEISEDALKSLESIAMNQEFSYNNFEVDGIKYFVTTTSSTNDQNKINGKPGEYFKQAEHWTIYIWEDLPEKIQRAIFFQEIVEIYLIEKFHIEKTSGAHDLSLFYEEIFNKGFLSVDEQKMIQELRSKYSSNML